MATTREAQNELEGVKNKLALEEQNKFDQLNAAAGKMHTKYAKLELSQALDLRYAEAAQRELSNRSLSETRAKLSEKGDRLAQAEAKLCVCVDEEQMTTAKKFLAYCINVWCG